MKQEDIDLELDYAEKELYNTSYHKLQNGGRYIDSFGEPFNLTNEEKEVLENYIDDSTKYQIKYDEYLDSAIYKGFINKNIYAQRFWRKDDFIKLFGKENYICYKNKDYELIDEKSVVIKNYISCSDADSSYGTYICGKTDCVKSIIYIPKGTNLIIFGTAFYPMGYENEHEILLGRNHKLTLLGMSSKEKVVLCELS